jgi:two-component system CheB/CheR fusion protein
MLNKKPVAIEDIFTDPRIPIEAYKPTFVKSLAMVPIRQADPIGAIGNYWANKHEATEKEISILQALADTTSVAIENVRLISSLEDRVRELENANQVKDEFLMLISHELRTPLNSIMGWSEMLVAETHGDISNFQTGLQSIYRNSKEQCQVVDRVLDASSIVLGKFKIKKEEMDLLPLVKESIEFYGGVAKRRGILISFNSSLSHAILNGDRDRLKQVIDNLIDNAIKFSNESGRILVDLSLEGPSVSLKVRDYGIGIDLQSFPHLFNRFSQAEKYITRSHGGLGLGLTISKNIIESHSGQITVSSQGRGYGTEFCVSLPLLAQQMASSSSALHHFG